MSKRISKNKNLSLLLANMEDARVAESPIEVIEGEKIYNMDINRVKPNPEQPRKYFDEKAQKELEESIKVHGIIQPLILVKMDDYYQIVAGERRYRAAKKAGLSTVPAIVKKYNGQKIREISLIENLQREDLNAIEEAEAIKELQDMYDLTQEAVAAKICKSRSNIANTLRLLSLPRDVKDLVRANRLSAGHARALIPIEKEDILIDLAYKAADAQMSVRELEQKVKLVLNPNLVKPKDPYANLEKISLEMRGLVDDMKRIFSTKVKAVGNDNRGRIYIDYYTKDDLQRIFDLMEKLKDSD